MRRHAPGSFYVTRTPAIMFHLMPRASVASPAKTGATMAKRVAVIGTGTIGASWAAYFLARGLEVGAYDPSPHGEALTRRFIDNAWPTLEKLGAVKADADRKRFEFFGTPEAAA